MSRIPDAAAECPQSPVSRALPALVGALALLVGLALFAAPGEAREGERPAADSATVSRAVDAFVQAKLEAQDVAPAPRSADEEFLRRLYLDVLGTVPTADEVESFLRDRAGDKRTKKIDELLASDAYAENWATWWYRTLTGLSPHARRPREGQGGRYLAGEGGQKFHAWLSDQMAKNRPYDEIARDLITATGRTDENGATGYLARWESDVNNTAGAVARHFLGVQIQCAQCHDHLYEPDWKQKDFQGMASFFTLTSVRRVPEYRELQQLRRQMQDAGKANGKKGAGKGRDLERPGKDGGDMDGGMDGDMDGPGAMPADRRGRAEKLRELAKYRNIVEVQDARVDPRMAGRLARRLKQAKNPELKARADLMATTPKFWMASEAPDVPGIPRRYILARWITDEGNAAFGKTAVNRLWAALMGRGIVSPVDDFNSFNEPSHPELLDMLAKDFVAHGHDLKRTLRILLNTDVYQRTSRWTGEDEPDAALFANAPIRPLSTEQLYYALVRATGMETQLSRASRRQQQQIQQAIFAAFSFVFDDDEGKEEQDFEGSIPQGLFLMNGELIQRAISGGNASKFGKRGGKRRRGGRETPLEKLLRDEPSDAARVSALYLRAYGRKPDAAERRGAVGFVKKHGGEVKAYEDLMWAILNSAEFMTNH